jgi:uncharacterized OB-fold protein
VSGSGGRHVPVPDADSAAFWDGAQRGVVALWRCRGCGHRQLFPPQRCRACGSAELEVLEAAGTGTVYTYTVVRRPPSPAWADRVPYVVALVELDEGVRLLSQVVDCPVDEVRIGLPVRAAFERLTEEVVLPVFRPA